jgi:chloramphenicol 3-O-phosphotransferase
MSQKMSVLAALAVLAGAGVMMAGTTYAQTSGMERRDDRRDDRQSGRAAKQACKAGDEKSRPECRQQKRATKHAPDQPAPAASQPPPH